MLKIVLMCYNMNLVTKQSTGKAHLPISQDLFLIKGPCMLRDFKRG